MHEFGNEFLDAKLLEAVRNAVRERSWVMRDLMWPRQDEALGGAWGSFCSTVDRDDDVRMTGEIPPAAILEEVGSLVRRLPERLLHLPAGHEFWRARIHDDAEGRGCLSARGLGTVPPERAKQANRMSPAGIPLFYGAETSDTAVREVANGAAKFVSFASFTTSRSCVVDLTTLPDVGMFDPVRGRDRRGYRFLNRFAETLSQRVEPGDVHIDYVPT